MFASLFDRYPQMKNALPGELGFIETGLQPGLVLDKGE
jgi:hypothetical protein